MLEIAVKYGLLYGGLVDGAVQFTLGLMEGDAATFKQGYTRENAVLAAVEAFELNDIQRDELENKLFAALD